MDRIDVLEHRIDQLEAEVVRLRATRPGAVPTATAARPERWAPPAVAVGPPPWPQPRVAAAPVPRSIRLDQERVLKWGGVGLVVLAIVFAVSTAVSRGWIGREVQLAAALAVAVAMVLTGVRLRDDRRGWMHALCTGGVIGAHVTIASPLLRDLTAETTAMAATAVLAIVGLLLAAGLRSEWVAGAATISGALGWFVSAGGDPAEFATAIWLGVLLAAAVLLACTRRWFGARVIAWLTGATALASVAFTADAVGDRVAVGVVAVAFALAWATLAGDGPVEPDWRQLELVLVTLAGPWLCLAAVDVLDLTGEVSIGTTALVLGGASGALALALRERMLGAHMIATVVGAIALVALGFAVLLDGPVTVLALVVEACGVLLLAGRLRDGTPVLAEGLLLLSVGALVLGGQLLEAWRIDAAFGDDVVRGAAVAAVAAAAWIVRRREFWGIVAAGALALLLGWLGSVFVHLPQGQAIVSITWATVGTAVLVAGAVRKQRRVGEAGLAVLGLTAAKLLTVDLEQVDTLWRAGLFLVVGLVFLRLGYLLPRLTSLQDGPADDGRGPAPTGEPASTSPSRP